jgi:hypothetical protein
MTVKVKIKKDDYGMTYQFTVENIDYSDSTGYTSKLYVWKGDTILVDAGVCTAVYSSTNTVVSHVVVDGDFDTIGEWDAEIEFTKTGFRESTETFIWEVIETGMTGV